MDDNSNTPVAHFRPYNKNAAHLKCIWVNLFHVYFLVAAYPLE